MFHAPQGIKKQILMVCQFLKIHSRNNLAHANWYFMKYSLSQFGNIQTILISLILCRQIYLTVLQDDKIDLWIY